MQASITPTFLIETITREDPMVNPAIIVGAMDAVQDLIWRASALIPDHCEGTLPDGHGCAVCTDVDSVSEIHARAMEVEEGILGGGMALRLMSAQAVIQIIRAQ